MGFYIKVGDMLWHGSTELRDQAYKKFYWIP